LVFRYFILRKDRIHRAFGLAQSAVNTLIRMNHEHIGAFVEAVHRADFDTVGMFTLDAVLADDEGHTTLLRLRSGVV
jgi:hypothetical protein